MKRNENQTSMTREIEIIIAKFRAEVGKSKAMTAREMKLIEICINELVCKKQQPASLQGLIERVEKCKVPDVEPNSYYHGVNVGIEVAIEILRTTPCNTPEIPTSSATGTMTARDLKHTAITVIDKYKSPVYQFTALELEMFCEQLCREQREICSREIKGWPPEVEYECEIQDDVLNAPMPDL